MAKVMVQMKSNLRMKSKAAGNSQHSVKSQNRVDFLMFVGFGLALASDQISKWIAELSGVVILINSGISFGWLAGISRVHTQSLIIVLTLSILVVLMIGLRQIWERHPLLAGIFFGSGVSNLLDRCRYSGVRDFLVVPGTSIHNNLADYLIFLSLITLVLVQWREFYAPHVAPKNTPNDRLSPD